MQLVLIDLFPDSKAALLGRVQEGLRQAEIHRFEVVEVAAENISQVNWSVVVGCLLGPGCYESLGGLVEEIRAAYPVGPIGAVLESDIYAGEGVGLRKRLGIVVMAINDLAQIASFLIDCEKNMRGPAGGQRNRGVVGVCQFKGGVGTTTLAAALASCWARHGLHVVALDLDDVNPQLTAWARVVSQQRRVVAELLRTGDVPAARLNEIVHPVEGFEGRFVVVGQPENYNEAFHMKANVLEGAPSASEFIGALFGQLQSEFDVVVIDMARSWGIAAFASLPFCQSVLLVTDDDGMSVRRTLDGLERLKNESEDPEEFDLTRWSLVLNGFTGRLISPKEIAAEIQEMELFSAESNLWTVPFSESGRQWGAPGQTFFETADERARMEVRKIAHSLIPFKFEKASQGFSGKLLHKLQTLVGKE